VNDAAFAARARPHDLRESGAGLCSSLAEELTPDSDVLDALAQVREQVEHLCAELVANAT